MAGYWTDTFLRTPVIQAQQIACYRSIAEKLIATSFFISRATCLWDAVGHFLGSLVWSQGPCPAGLSCQRVRTGSQVSSIHFK